MYRACELKDQILEKIRTLHSGENKQTKRGEREEDAERKKIDEEEEKEKKRAP